LAPDMLASQSRAFKTRITA